MEFKKICNKSQDPFEYLFSEDSMQTGSLKEKIKDSSSEKSENELKKNNLINDSDSEESEFEWEDFDIYFKNTLINNSEKEYDLETTIEQKVEINNKRRRHGITKNDRKLRLEIHKLHLLCLISHSSLRNYFCRDKRIHAKLKSILPNEIQQLFNPDKRISQYRKSKMFMNALRATVNIWKRKFKKNKYGISKPFWTISEPNNEYIKKSYDNISCFDDFLTAAEQLQGSRDLGAQLFVALLDSNNVNARLTVFLQPLSYKFDKSSSLHNSISTTSNKNNNNIEFKDNYIYKNTSKNLDITNNFENRNKIEQIELSKYSKSNLLSTSNNFSDLLNDNESDIEESLHPIYWTEALNPSTQKWIFVDPMVSYLVGKPSKMESLISKSKNSLSYIISFDRNGYVKDVTRRYTKHFNSKIKKQRIDSIDEGKKWWEKVLNFYRLDYISQPFDIIEDEEFLERQTYEKIPKSVKDLKNHPLFIIERHLKREQIISSKKPCSYVTIKVNGNQVKEPIFYRKDIITVLSAGKWYQRGRKIKFGEQPMKIVPKYKEFALQNESESTIKHNTIGLYSESQTELYIPPPVVNGKVPKNSYGNLDIFVSSMIPKGAVHLPFPGISRAAKFLGIDYADTVIGFKFEKKRSLPIIKGIIIAQEFEEAVYLTFKIMEEEKNEKTSEKMKEIILMRWRQKVTTNDYHRLKKYDNSEKTTYFGFKEVPEFKKEELVQNVFKSVASSYDKMNDIMSLGIHRLWKDEFVQRLDPGTLDGEPMDLLDVAGGTGDIAFRLLDHATDIHFDTQTKVKCVDLNPEMLEIGKKRLENSRYKYSKRIDFFIQNAENLVDIPSSSINIYTIAFGIRNCTQIMNVLKEAYRVLKPGGIFSCLEFSKISLAPLEAIYNYYTFHIIPIIGHIVVGDRDSYQYLAESIAKHFDQKTFSKMMKDAGFKLVGDGYHNLSFGIAAIHTGIKL
ncbi:hypothetical protein PMAC_002079 [Pneumocystis sp. 'macacae']|nr:hypothetical protein PMAC_002079 [Pneumocystis sp. 'macacae']